MHANKFKDVPLTHKIHMVVFLCKRFKRFTASLYIYRLSAFCTVRKSYFDFCQIFSAEFLRIFVDKPN